MIIYGLKIKLTGLELEDQLFLNDLMNDPLIEHMTAGECFPVSKYSQNSWFQKHGNSSDPCRLAKRTSRRFLRLSINSLKSTTCRFFIPATRAAASGWKRRALCWIRG